VPWTAHKVHVPKPGEPSATIKFASSVAGTTYIYMLDEARCESSSFGYVAGALTSLFGLEKEIAVRAERRLHVRISGSDVSSVRNNEVIHATCGVNFSLIPESNAYYIVNFRKTTKGCDATVFRTIKQDNEEKEIIVPTLQKDCMKAE
jgi:hypothetical protein